MSGTREAATLIKPQKPSGFIDYTPAQTLARERMFRAIESVYRTFGFIPLQTSVGQRRSVLTGKKPVGKILWNLRADRSKDVADEDRIVTARFDLTVPLARYVAENIGALTFPFKRFERGVVYRGEKAQLGRYCEFTQLDGDIVGAATGPADAEIIACMHEVMRALGIDKFVIRVNNRKILDGFSERVGCAVGSEEAAALLRLFDKIDDLGLEGVLARLAATEVAIEPSGDENPQGDEEILQVFAFNAERIALVREFMALLDGAAGNDERLARLERYFDGHGPGAQGVRELQAIAPLVRAHGVDESKWTVDSSVVRGLGYYSGPVFETFLLEGAITGSVFSGGRYDDLVARFTGESLPAVGASVGVDRLFAALESLNAAKAVEPEVDAFIVTMDPSLMPQYFAMAAELRAAGVRVEVNMNYQDTKLAAQLATALSRRAPAILFYGPDDAAKGTVAVKRTDTRKQTSVPRGNLVREVLTILRPST